MPPAPKDPSTRRRRNREVTAVELTGRRKGRQPTIPVRKAHPRTQAWWRSVWQSPMSAQYTEPDVEGISMLCLVVEDFWRAESSTARREAAAEIRQQSVRFGLSPIDRRRLQWSLPKAPPKQAAEAKAGRRAPLAVVPAGPDPRSFLTA